CCSQTGTYNGRVVFLETNSRLRTHESFNLFKDNAHHNSVTPLHALNLGLVSVFPLDYMHLVCLGVMRKLLYTWCFGKVPHKWSQKQIQSVSNSLVSLKSY